MRVTALMSVYNDEEHVERGIRHLMVQSYLDLDILVIDSGSTDKTPEILKTLPVRVVSTARETLYGAWNRGLKLAQGELIIINNSDDWLEWQAVERLVAAFETPGVVLTYSDLLVHCPDGIKERPEPAFDKDLLKQYCYVGCSPMFRKDVAEQLGGFDDTFHISGDWEMWLRMSEVGDFAHVPGYYVHYNLNPKGLEFGNPEQRRIEDERIRTR